MGRRKEVAKNKIVEFKLSRVMTMPLLLKEGHRRNEIIELFSKLASMEYGEYIKGKRGAGNPAKFIANENCPDTFPMVFKIFRNRRTKEEMGKDTKIEQVKDTNNHKNKLRMQYCPESSDKGYAIGIGDNKAYLVRLPQGGFHSIEGAVKASWKLFEERATFFKSRIMNEHTQIVSKLKGTGYVQLKGNSDASD